MSAKSIGDIVTGVITFGGYFFGMEDRDFRPTIVFLFIIMIFALSVVVSCAVQYWVENRKHGNKQWNGNGIGQ